MRKILSVVHLNVLCASCLGTRRLLALKQHFVLQSWRLAVQTQGGCKALPSQNLIAEPLRRVWWSADHLRHSSANRTTSLPLWICLHFKKSRVYHVCFKVFISIYSV